MLWDDYQECSWISQLVLYLCKIKGLKVYSNEEFFGSISTYLPVNMIA